MAHRTQLLIIDPQNDFCDLPAADCPSGCRPALPVPGAHADLLRVAALVDASGDALDAITVTLDGHHALDIAHPPFWQCGDGQPVAPFTAITAQQVRAGLYRPRDALALPRTLAYLDALQAQGRYTLMVWPIHCVLGQWGQQVHAALWAACQRWQARTGRTVVRVSKGANPWTEHYSAVQAEVPDQADPSTRSNTVLLARLDAAERLLIAGEAGSHCVRATTDHLLAQLPSGRPQRLWLLTDCISPVAGFEAEQTAWLQSFQAQGGQALCSADALGQLRALLPA
jgi:nicotinamidase-related amidase